MTFRDSRRSHKSARGLTFFVDGIATAFQYSVITTPAASLLSPKISTLLFYEPSCTT
jgi:hypothetical protein